MFSGGETDALLIINDFPTSYVTGTKCQKVNQADYRSHIIMFLLIYAYRLSDFPTTNSCRSQYFATGFADSIRYFVGF